MQGRHDAARWAYWSRSHCFDGAQERALPLRADRRPRAAHLEDSPPRTVNACGLGSGGNELGLRRGGRAGLVLSA